MTKPQIAKIWVSAGVVIISAGIPAYTKSIPQLSEAKINGAEHPELIPDAIAYRLVFLRFSLPPSPNARELARQESHLRRIGLEANEEAKLTSTLASFSSQYSSWAVRYAGRPGSVSERNAIVQSSLAEINEELSPAGQKLFQQYVTGEKHHMKVPK